MDEITTLKTELLAKLEQLLAATQTQQPPAPSATTPAPSTLTSAIYAEAKGCLDKHITLNPSVPAEVGCAEAVSYVLSLAGVDDGAQGIAGTAALDAWLAANKNFVKVTVPEPGVVLVSPTGAGNGTVEGHTGIVAQYNLQYPNDWGIMSNNSSNGLFQEQWSLSAWTENYHVKGGLPLNFYKRIS